MSAREVLDRLRGEACPGAVPVQWLDDAMFSFGSLPLPPIALGLAGTQRVQEGLPARTVAAWRAIARAFPDLSGLGAWGDRSHQARKSCHNSGKAIDCMTTSPAMHARVVAFLLDNRAALDVTLIISRRRKWSAATGWKPRPYLGSSPHTDHVHASIDCAG